ncbi:MAG TPA: glycosyltransferase family 87 protein [Chloroflexota bacterium]|nr:glycosyltransferase family 87 protein [Chloroflexota bacterium]
MSLDTNRDQHAVGKLLSSPSRRARTLRAILGACAVGLGLLVLRRSLGTLVSPYVYSKDFLGDYLVARAVVGGADPYAPVAVLATRYLGDLPALPGAIFPHPTQHPPIVGMMLAPLTIVGYPLAATAWFALELGCLIGSVYLLGAIGGRRPAWLATLAIAAGAFAWYPITVEVEYGQLVLLSLLLLCSARLAWLSGRSSVSGGLVGLAVLIKPVPWPLILLFALRRDWRAFVVSSGTVVLGYGISAVAVGYSHFLSYFTKVNPPVTYAYRGDAANQSLWTVGWRVFEGTQPAAFGDLARGGFAASPVITSLPAALIVSPAVPVLALLGACLVARSRLSLDASLGLMICVSVLVSPISFGYDLALCAIPIVQVIDWLAAHGYPARQTNAALLVATLLIVPDSSWGQLAFVLGSLGNHAGQSGAIAFAPALLSLGPAVAVGALALLVVWVAGPERTGRPDLGAVAIPRNGDVSAFSADDTVPGRVVPRDRG